MRYQQQRAQMSPNWREKEAMSTQKLMAATTHLHLKQDEEITRLRRNVSSLAKKNHGLMRQVHELVSRLRQYPPPRIPEETRPTNQDEETQEDPSPETKEDTQMKDVAEPQVNDDSSLYSLFEPKPREPTPQQSMEYEILPDAVEDSPTPTPTPTPPIQQAQLQPLPPSHLPPPPALPAPISEAKRTIKEPARVEHTPLPETPIPVDTHPDEEVISVTIVATGDGRFDRQCEKRMRYNAIRKEEEAMTIRGWMCLGAEKRDLQH
ncbi:hypothetical protein DFP73DRAFT_529425 [Morchella snyderi]|nr:hypothetical protein DFP73DRAFT_529425 [Morchella snyderi]